VVRPECSLYLRAKAVSQCNMVPGKREKTQVGTSGKSNVFAQQILKNVFVGLQACPNVRWEMEKHFMHMTVEMNMYNSLIFIIIFRHNAVIS
jgi:hypothetical protein